MKKILLLICMTLMLTGCSAGASLKALEADLQALATAEIKMSADNNKSLYRYYSSPDVGRRVSTQTANVFTYRNDEFIMNLDIATIINEEFYDSVDTFRFNVDESMLSISGPYTNTANEEFEFSFQVYDFNESKYLIYMETQYVNFYSYCEYTNIAPMALEMMKIAKTVEVEKETIITLYSSKPTTEYVREQVDLFEETIADNGRIEELLEGNNVIEGDNMEHEGLTDDTVVEEENDDTLEEEVVETEPPVEEENQDNNNAHEGHR